MIKKLSLVLILLFLFASALSADQFTTNYSLQIPQAMSRDWLPQISRDIISIDAFLNMLSYDLGTSSIKGIISSDKTATTGSGAVGRIRINTGDSATPAYILIYGP